MKKLIILFIPFLIIGCTTTKEIVYYQDIDNQDLEPVPDVYSHNKIQINDILNIEVAALNPESVAPYKFNTGGNNQQQIQNIEMLKLIGYMVNSDGKINFPQLGRIEAGGKNTQELELYLEELLKEFITNPTVRVRIINFKFTFEGEVNNPGTYETTEENITLQQAFGMAGGLGIRGKRENILIIRQLEGERVVKRIDMTKTDWMNTEYAYVKPNDIIYVEPNKPQIASAGFITNIGTVLSVVSILTTLTLLITR
ncbi:polysaccharide export outer membrane protein Wza-like protein [Psychroflexus torquis ATCC 700755]|uniref:Polysaccharide export outer membrane protein Wza-like protein n=1 Tax=Psychroflexus torquis (strain ATCC 700755 / CIP 106069 / ACAM 623) TaxID=313595 RepID=K4IF90_PSYTT|nr:polysaccharide biosynthesis/export family protein [Psychroflexus torquis]AFU69049.1 polysaccharide export outer membrane protein Wza-like protein [Psychroflexus torquis ATCC 700755]